MSVHELTRLICAGAIELPAVTPLERSPTEPLAVGATDPLEPRPSESPSARTAVAACAALEASESVVTVADVLRTGMGMAHAVGR